MELALKDEATQSKCGLPGDPRAPAWPWKRCEELDAGLPVPWLGQGSPSWNR